MASANPTCATVRVTGGLVGGYGGELSRRETSQCVRVAEAEAEAEVGWVGGC